jgi:hypothetical protein
LCIKDKKNGRKREEYRENTKLITPRLDFKDGTRIELLFGN